MAKNKSPFKDNKELERDIQIFLNMHRATFAQEVSRTSSYFELAVFNDVVRFYENNGYEVLPKNLKPQKRQFVYALSPNAKPENVSYFHVIKKYKRKPSREFEIRHNLRIQSSHDEHIFISPDYAVIEPESISSERLQRYYNGKSDYFFVEANNIATFAETKHYNPSPELILNFVGLVNEIMPELMNNAAQTSLPKHFGPALFVSGVGNAHTKSIGKSLKQRYSINVLLGLFAYPSQLYSVRNQPNIKKIGSKKH